MQSPRKIQYTISEGDNLYQLSRYYQTTVQEILALNPGIDPYNLQIGSSVMISPGDRFKSREYDSNPPACPNTSMQFNLLANMREVWVQHAYWSRLLLISIAERLQDQDDTEARLLENPADIARIFANYYSAGTAEVIEQLLTEHLRIGAELITALRDGRTTQAEELEQRWYQNADRMAEAFSSMNPYYRLEGVQGMLHEHLDLLSQEIAARLAGNYKEDIEASGEVEQEILKMADYFSSGIMQQFPQNFM